MSKVATFFLVVVLALVLTPIWIWLLVVSDIVWPPYAFLSILLPIVVLFIGRGEYHRWEHSDYDVTGKIMLDQPVSNRAKMAAAHTTKRTLSLIAIFVVGLPLASTLVEVLSSVDFFGNNMFFGQPLSYLLGGALPTLVLVIARMEFHDWDLSRARPRS